MEPNEYFEYILSIYFDKKYILMYLPRRELDVEN